MCYRLNAGEEINAVELLAFEQQTALSNSTSSMVEWVLSDYLAELIDDD